MSKLKKSGKRHVDRPSPPSQSEVSQLLDFFNRRLDKEGIELAKALLERSPSFGFGWKALGAMLNRQNLPEEALSAMEHAAGLMPDDAETHSNLGVMYKALNRNTEAEDCYRRALEISPQAANAHNNLGNLLCEQGKLQEAEQHLLRALELRPEYPDALLNLGNTFFEQGRHSEAEQCFRQCLALAREHVKAWFGLGLAVSKQGRHPEAAPCYRKVISLAPDNFAAYNNLGVALQSMGEIEDAMRCFEQASRINPAFVDAYNNLAVAMLNGLDPGNLNGVTAYLQAVLRKTEPQASWRFATLQMIAYQIGGDYAKAADVCRDFKETVEQIALVDNDQQSLKAFFAYLADLLLFRQTHPALYQPVSPANRVEVIGESHCLSPAHSHFTWGTESCIALPRFIMGIKMHHLAGPGVHRMKLLLAQHLSRIETSSHLLFAIGEIDCRPQEGIWMAAKKGKGSLREIIDKTVDGYLLCLKDTLAGKSFASITVQGIPAPGNSLAGVTSVAEQPVFLAMIREVNARLKNGAVQLGWDFLDVYAATAGPDGYGNGQWHLDGIHLSPNFYQVAQRWRIGAAGQSLSAEQWKNRGNAFYAQGKLDEAVACYRQAIAVDAHYAPSYNNLGSICFVRGQVSEAVACFRQALALQLPRSSGTMYSLGLALYAAGAMGEAQECFEGTLTLAADSWTADAQACLGVIYFLTDQIDKLKSLLGQVKPGLGSANKLQSYFGYLADLLRWRESGAALTDPVANLDTLHIVGESHALAWHGLRTSVAGRDYRCQSTWILGCKQWHLAKPGENQYKFQVRRALKSLPVGASVVLAFGEIDCRPDEGIWQAFKKGKGSLNELIAKTVDGYLNWLAGELTGKQIVVTVQGVPAPGYALEGIKPDLSEFLEMIRAFNECLRNGALARGWGFLDVYAATADQDGGSHQRWHLDGIHLSPTFYLQADHWRLARCEDEDFARRAAMAKSQIERFGRVPMVLHQLGEALLLLQR
jgi:tetratricopeptide (TPR) repeat protein